MKIWLFLFIFFFQVANTFLGAFELKTRLTTAAPGDFIVYQYKSHITLVRIAKHSPNELVIEEITAPKGDYNWQEWLNKNAPEHTSWTITTLEPTTLKTLSSYSLDEPSAVATTDLQFLPTLLKLQLQSIPTDEQKKIGAEPMAGEVDMRKIWHPKIMWKGKSIDIPIDAFKAMWPKDESELAGKIIEVYIPQKEALSYFPYWIEIGSGPLKAKVQAIDSGSGLSSKISVSQLSTTESSISVDNRS
jgi:hypothetical protein